MKKYLFIATLLTVASGLFTGCGHKEHEASTSELPVVKVKTAKVEWAVHTRSQWLPGTVYPSEQAVVASKLMASVFEAAFTIGQVVSAGEVLITLSADEIDAQVEQARAALAQIERNYNREKSLLAQNATTAETVRTLEDQMRMAQARLTESLTMVSYKTIRAPFDGIVTAKNVRRGDLASPGMPLLSIEGVGNHKVHVQVPDSLSALPYQSLIRIEANGNTLECPLAEWSPAADPASRTRLAKLDVLPNVSVRSGQYVRVAWPAGETKSLWIPENAAGKIGQIERVFVVADGKANLRIIKSGSRRDGMLQVLSGVRENEVIVTSPSAHLRDGQPVETN